MKPQLGVLEERSGPVGGQGGLSQAVKASPAGRRLTGHFAVFNEWTRITDKYGTYMERIAPGAFARSFARETPKLMFQHGRDVSVGEKLLGKVTSLEEDGHGARYEADLYDVGYVNDLLPGLRDGLYGASFRFRAVRQDHVERPGYSQWNPEGLPERTVKEAHVVEFGPVVFPAYRAATAVARSGRIVEKLEVEARVATIIGGAPLTDGVEVGGLLYGGLRGSTLVVAAATIDLDAERGPNSFRHSKTHRREVEDKLVGLQLVGNWHSHPYDEEELRAHPSSDDLAAWQAGAGRIAAGLWVGLIVTPGARFSFELGSSRPVRSAHRWRKPSLTAFIAERGSSPALIDIHWRERVQRAAA